MARAATIEHTTTGITITVENAPGHYTFDHAADGTYVQGCGEWDGQAVVIYSTARWAYDTEPGDLVTLTGATVKRHSVYDGTPQTTLGGRMKAAKG